MPKILIPTPLRQYADKKDSVELEGGTVGEVLTELISHFPDLRKQIFTEEGRLRSFVNVYLNDEDIRYLEREATPVMQSDTVSIVPSIAGGATQVAGPLGPVGLGQERRGFRPDLAGDRGRARRSTLGTSCSAKCL